MANEMSLTLDSGSHATLVLLDHNAAFDSDHHGVLLKWLKCEGGIQGLVLKWFESYLKGSTMVAFLTVFSSHRQLLSHKAFHEVPYWPLFYSPYH